jgi:hypothetical protein
MDVNYSRWMSKDPDAEPDEIENEPRRFSLPKPPRSVVASGVLVALVVLGVGTVGRSLTTSDASSSQEQAVATPSPQESSGPGAAGVEEDTMFDDSTTSDDSTIPDGETYDVDDDRVLRRLDEPPMPMRNRLRPGPRVPGPPPRAHVEIRSFGEPGALNDSDGDDDEDEDEDDADD